MREEERRRSSSWTEVWKAGIWKDSDGLSSAFIYNWDIQSDKEDSIINKGFPIDKKRPIVVKKRRKAKEKRIPDRAPSKKNVWC